MAEIGNMTWRRFMTLLRYLSGDSVTVNIAHHEKQNPVISEPKDVDAYIRQQIGGSRVPAGR